MPVGARNLSKYQTQTTAILVVTLPETIKVLGGYLLKVTTIPETILNFAWMKEFNVNSISLSLPVSTHQQSGSIRTDSAGMPAVKAKCKIVRYWFFVVRQNDTF